MVKTRGLVFDHGFADVDVDAFVLGRGGAVGRIIDNAVFGSDLW